jgi:Conserved region in glutamate synthase
MVQGADFTNAARALMFAIGRIQAQNCRTNTCPTGVVTQGPRRARALHVDDKSVRGQRFQSATVSSAMKIITSLGVSGPAELHPHMLRRRVHPVTAPLVRGTLRMAGLRAVADQAAGVLGGGLPEGRRFRPLQRMTRLAEHMAYAKRCAPFRSPLSVFPPSFRHPRCPRAGRDRSGLSEKSALFFFFAGPEERQ